MTTGQIACYKTGQIINSRHHPDFALTPKLVQCKIQVSFDILAVGICLVWPVLTGTQE